MFKYLYLEYVPTPCDCLRPLCFADSSHPQSIIVHGPVGVLHTGSGDAQGENIDLTTGNASC